MDFSNMIFINAEIDRSILSQENADQIAQQTTEIVAIGEPAEIVPIESSRGGNMTWLIIYTVLIAVMWTLIMKPQKRREKKMKEMHANIKVGDSVVTTGGLYGKVVDIGTDVYLLEFGTNKGVRIPVNKTELADIKEPNLSTPKAETEE